MKRFRLIIGHCALVEIVGQCQLPPAGISVLCVCFSNDDPLNERSNPLIPYLIPLLDTDKALVYRIRPRCRRARHYLARLSTEHCTHSKSRRS